MTILVPNRNLLENTEVSQVTAYKYLGHEIKIGRNNETFETDRRIRLKWTAF